MLKEFAHNWAGALAHYWQAEALLRAHLADDPDNDMLQQKLIEIYQKIGAVLVRTGRHDDAMAMFDQSIAMAKARLEQAPLNVMRIRALVNAYQGVSIAMISTFERGVVSSRREIALSAEIAAAAVIETAAMQNGGHPPEIYKYSALLRWAMSSSELLGLPDRALAIAQRRADGLVQMGEKPHEIALALRDVSRLRLFAGDFHRARMAAEDALLLDPSLDELRRLIAHAAMFLNDRSFFQAMHEVRGHRHRSDRAIWHLAVLNDFKELRAHGQSTHFMAEVEAILALSKPTDWPNVADSLHRN